MGVWILAALLIAAIWVVGLFAAALGLGAKIGLTVLVLAFVGLTLAYRRWAALRAAKALERELLKQAEDQVAAARPDRRAEIAELGAGMKRSLSALKDSKLGGSGAALYALPWYVIVGPPGAGKTTAIRCSGLPFPQVGDASAVRGVGGTRNCDWWFTNEGILLDTAGRYAVEQDDREEWFAFLDLLRRHRARSPINGLIVAISIADIAGATEEQIDRMATTLRARLDEVMTRLRMVFPVYVLVTKADLVAGFVEFWEDLKKSERAQIWGFSLPASASPQAPKAAFEREYATLTSVLHALSVQRLGTVRGAEQRVRVLQYPGEMEALAANLGQLVDTLFQANKFQETPLLRGLYFTSGTQEGTPLERVLSGMARAFGLRSDAPTGGPPTDPKSYFLTDLFREVIFRDKNLAAQTRGELRRRALVRAATLVSAFILAAAVIGPSIVSYRNNADLTVATAATGKALAGIDWDVDPPADRLEKLDAAEASLTFLEAGDVTTPSQHGWGLYVGGTLRPGLRSEYAAVVRNRGLEPIQRAIAGRLRSIESSPDVLLKTFNANHSDLKAYLMLTQVEPLDPEWLAARLAGPFAQIIGVTGDAKEAVVRRDLLHYFQLQKRGEVPPLERDARLVAYTRTELLRVPAVGRLYESLIRDANAEVGPIRYENIFYGAVATYVRPKRGVEVPGAYTAAGWARVRTLLEGHTSDLLSEAWVLGDEGTTKDEIERRMGELRDAYFGRYTAAWRAFLADLSVVRPENAQKALDELLSLTEPEWPYLRLLRTLNENVVVQTGPPPDPALAAVSGALDRKVQGVVGAIGSAAGIGSVNAPSLALKAPAASPMEVAFRPLTTFAVPAVMPKPGDAPVPTGLGQYETILHTLIGVLTDLRDAKAAPDPKAMTEAFQTAFRATSGLVADQTELTRPLLTPLLMDPITLSWSSVVSDAAGAAGGLWEVTVWKPCSAKEEGRYPFDAHAATDVTVKDYADFFRPKDGILWGFYDANLKGSLDKQGDDFVPVRRFAAAPPYDGPFLAFLRRAGKISDATFDGKNELPEVDFDVNLHGVSADVAEVFLEIDGVRHDYRNAPEEWVHAKWPSPDAEKRGAKVRVRGISGLDEEIARPGDFGLFRLLAAASIDRAPLRPGFGGDTPHPGAETRELLTATWKLRSQPGAFVSIDFRPARTAHPFAAGFFDDLRCPRSITHGAR